MRKDWDSIQPSIVMVRSCLAIIVYTSFHSGIAPFFHSSLVVARPYFDICFQELTYSLWAVHLLIFSCGWIRLYSFVVVHWIAESHMPVDTNWRKWGWSHPRRRRYRPNKGEFASKNCSKQSLRRRVSFPIISIHCAVTYWIFSLSLIHCLLIAPFAQILLRSWYFSFHSLPMYR